MKPAKHCPVCGAQIGPDRKGWLSSVLTDPDRPSRERPAMLVLTCNTDSCRGGARLAAELELLVAAAAKRDPQLGPVWDD